MTAYRNENGLLSYEKYSKFDISNPFIHEFSYINIYTPSVFCYDKHKKNFDIQFPMKRHETVQRRIMTPVE